MIIIEINFSSLVAELKTGREKREGRKEGRKEGRGKELEVDFHVRAITRTHVHARTYTRVPRTHSNTEAQSRGGGGGGSTNGSSRIWRLFDHAIATRGGWCTRSRGGGRRRVMCSGRQPATNCGSWPPCSSATPEQGWLSALARRAPFTQTVKNASVWLHPFTNTRYQFF